jgi:uncharacterized protein YciI
MFHVVLLRSGPEWDSARPMEEQPGWTEHAAFMEDLVENGFLVMGGPLPDGLRVVHAVEAYSEEDVRATLSEDPWNDSILRIDTVERWFIRLDGRHR